jgi:hypothetical protein
MSVLRVNQIANENGDGPVEFTQGATFPASQTFTDDDLVLNTVGVATINTLNVNSMNVVGVMTGTFVGNGFNITNPPGTPVGKVIGQHLIT